MVQFSLLLRIPKDSVQEDTLSSKWSHLLGAALHAETFRLEQMKAKSGDPV